MVKAINALRSRYSKPMSGTPANKSKPRYNSVKFSLTTVITFLIFCNLMFLVIYYYYTT